MPGRNAFGKTQRLSYVPQRVSGRQRQSAKPNGSDVSSEELERMALRLSADYKTSFPTPAKEPERRIITKKN